jgi:hypothetical protein
MSNISNITPPEGWRDAKMQIDGIEQIKTDLMADLSPNGISRRFAAEQHQMFLAGVLYGMALETGKDRRLEERHHFK